MVEFCPVNNSKKYYSGDSYFIYFYNFDGKADTNPLISICNK